MYSNGYDSIIDVVETSVYFAKLNKTISEDAKEIRLEDIDRDSICSIASVECDYLYKTFRGDVFRGDLPWDKGGREEIVDALNRYLKEQNYNKIKII